MTNEPTAAALGYGFPKMRLGRYVQNPDRAYEEFIILVYNLGVRSFSTASPCRHEILHLHYLGASIISMEEGVFEIIATVRDERIGSTGSKDSLFADTIALIKKALLDYHMTKTDIDYILITEGSDEVAHKLEEYFGKAPVKNIDEYEVVAHGAAYQANIIGNAYDHNVGCLVDVIPLALGQSLLYCTECVTKIQ
jgi:molecular chaperone DnaK (HSP70)